MMILSNNTKNNTSSHESTSLLYLRPEVAALKETLEQFVREECIPAESQYEHHIAQRHGKHRWTIDAIPPCIEVLKQRAKDLGLWNLFIPQHLRHKIQVLSSELLLNGCDSNNIPVLPSITLSYREYGIFCELLGRCTPIAAEVCNCNAPDTGNMEVLLEFGTIQQQRQYLIPLLHGTIRSTFLMTEPNVASSDPTNLETKLIKVAVPKKQQQSKNSNSSMKGRNDDDNDNDDMYEYEYHLSGRKWWSTGAMDPRCKCAFVVAKMDYTHPSLLLLKRRSINGSHQQQKQQFPLSLSLSSSSLRNPNSSNKSKNHHSAHTIVIVPLPHPKVQMIRPLTVFGYDDAPHGHAEVQLNHVIVSSNDIVLGESYGFQISQARLGPGRIHHCMRAVGIGTYYVYIYSVSFCSRLSFSA